MAVLFISLFALDAFEAGQPIAQSLAGFALHLVPSVILAIILTVAWRRETVGGALFIVVAIAPFVLLRNPVWVNLTLGGPFLLSGVLFLAAGRRPNGA